MQRCAAAIASRAPLKRLRDILHNSTRLAVTLEEAEALRSEIRRREWEEVARRAMGPRAAINAVPEVLAEAEAADATDTELYHKLKYVSLLLPAIAPTFVRFLCHARAC